MTEAQKRATNKYRTQTKTTIQIYVDKEAKLEYQNTAIEKGFSSLNQYIISLLEADKTKNK